MSGKEKTNGSLAMAPRVITIPAASQENTRKLRVAAYARVSSNSEDQKHSFAAQNAYYSKLITGNPNWELADIYADQGITGTSIDKRDDFLRMMEDCRKGRIDRILVKSSSRFARNAKESLEAVRELAALGVSVYFEEQNIDTAQVSGEVLIAMFAALAQRESEAISERVRWSYKVRMSKGRFSTCKAPYGYRLVKDHLEIQEDEVSIIRYIFDRYLAGVSMENIAKEITAMGCPTRDDTPYWQLTSIQYILQNEKYVGDSLSQKKYTTRSFPRQQKINHGEQKQYLAVDSHPAIISRENFQKAQELLARRSAVIHPRPDIPHPFARKVMCGHCGSLCRRKNCGGSVNWVCRKHDKSTTACPNTPVPEEQLKSAFLRLYYKLKHYGSAILTQLISDLHAAKTGSLLWSENIVEINKQISDIASQERLLTQLKQQGSVDPDIFISRGNLLAERRRELKLQKERILRSEEDHTIQQTQDLLDVLESGPDWLDDFDEQLFSDLVEKIVVVDNEKLCFRLLNGLEVTEKIERTQR
jgi:DNA invertase Pin-like site-specific DNA recombinase